MLIVDFVTSVKPLIPALANIEKNLNFGDLPVPIVNLAREVT
jgi:hypothetical protein